MFSKADEIRLEAILGDTDGRAELCAALGLASCSELGSLSGKEDALIALSNELQGEEITDDE